LASSSSEWILWVPRARNGDEDAFERLYKATRPRLHNVISHLVGDDQAQEIVQRAFVRLGSGLRTWRRTPPSPAGCGASL